MLFIVKRSVFLNAYLVLPSWVHNASKVVYAEIVFRTKIIFYNNHRYICIDLSVANVCCLLLHHNYAMMNICNSHLRFTNKSM